MSTPFRALALITREPGSDGTREEQAGSILVEAMRENGLDVTGPREVDCDRMSVADALRTAATEDFALVVTTGGTGLAPHHQVPEGTRDVIEREAPGLADLVRIEGMRHTPYAAVSRGVAGIAGATLVINLPGRANAVREGCDAVLPLMNQVLKQVRDTDH